MLCRTSHADFHHAKRRVLTPSGEWKTPILLGFLDNVESTVMESGVIKPLF